MISAGFLTASALVRRRSSHRSNLTEWEMTLAYASALAEARGCLAALAATATSSAGSIRYEQILLHLDDIHHPEGSRADTEYRYPTGSAAPTRDCHRATHRTRR